MLPCPIRLQKGPSPSLSWALSQADKLSGGRSRASLVKFTTFLLAAVTQIAAAAQQPTAIPPEIVVVPSGALRLRALLLLPENGGPVPPVVFNYRSRRSDAIPTRPFCFHEAAERTWP